MFKSRDPAPVAGRDTPVRVRSYWVSFGVLAVAVMAFSLIQSMTVPALPLLREELGASATSASWVITAQLLAASVATPIMGRLGDATGKNRILVVSLIALCIGSLMAAAAPTIEWLIAARVVQGLGGGVIPLSFGIIRDEFPEERRSSAISVTSSLLAVGFGVGIVIAGPLIDLVGYHWTFVIPAVVSAVAALVAAWIIPPSPVRSPGRISILPAVLLAAWLTCLLVGVSQAPLWGWGSPRVLALLAGSVVLVGAWMWSESRAAVPVVDLTMMRRRPVWTTNHVAVFIGVAMYSSFGYLPQLAQTDPSAGYGYGSTVTESGLILLPGAIVTFFMGLIATPLARWVGPQPLVVVACLVSAVGNLMSALWHDEPWQMSLSMAVTSAGIGLVFALLANLIVAAVPAEQTGVASGMNANVRTIGGAIGSGVTASVLAAHVMSGGLPSDDGYRAAFLVLAAAGVFAALAALLVPRISEDRLEEELADHPLPAK